MLHQVSDLALDVSSTDSGIALIYRALDALVAQFELEDAAVVLEERASAARSSARAGGRSVPPTRSCSSPRPACTPSPRSRTTDSTAR